ncbi:WD repeat-containing protein 91 [Morus notabilis]|uniref:WD repeat-containing protein 91 n=1 Tax=Morus notabilis TaxID=981085 RepID=W9SGR2_9ROSA|nr:WD repeat-containing protein 91 [Morus notabilis]
MENLQYAEELVREFLVFRGFTNTLQAFDSELSTDIGKAFQVDKIIDLIFSVYVPKFQAEKLVVLLNFFKRCLSSSSDFQAEKLVVLLNFFKRCLSSSSERVFIDTLCKLEVSILRYYIVYAVQSGRKDKVVEFYGMNGDEMMQRNQDWTPWFAIPYVKNPSSDPKFRTYFSREWFDALHLSISSEKIAVNRLKKDIKQLNLKLSELQALLEEKEAQLSQLRSNVSSFTDANIEKAQSSLGVVYEENLRISKDTREICSSDTLQVGETELNREWAVAASVGNQVDISMSKSGYSLSSSSSPRDGGISDSSPLLDSSHDENGRESHVEELHEVKVDFQETFLGHTSPISRCHFSASGNNIASASVDGTVRIWTYDSSTSASRNATIYCGAEIMSLDWECKSDRLCCGSSSQKLLIGTADGGIKAWNVDAKRVVCDLNTTEAFPSVLDIKCSPVEPIFVSAAASRGRGSWRYTDNLGFASLTVWNMKTWKPMILEWSLQNQGRVLWSRNCSRFCDPESSKHCRHEMALDANGKRLLVTSGSVRGNNGLKTLAHTAAITTVDWHPTLPIFLTGSADNSVRVTSIL